VGLAERYVRLVKTALQKELQLDPEIVKTWDRVVTSITMALNTRDLKYKGYTPFELMFGFKANTRRFVPTVHEQITVDSLQQVSDPLEVH